MNLKTKIGLWKGKEVEKLTKPELYELIIHLSKENQDLKEKAWKYDELSK